MARLRNGENGRGAPRSLPIAEWPKADRESWQEACRPGHRFRKGGSASHLADVSRTDIASRYGMFLDFLDRAGHLDRTAEAASHVNQDVVDRYIAELQQRVRSVTIWNCIYKLRRAAELMAPQLDFAWLSEIERDIALTMQPRSKFDRLVLAERLVEAGLTLVQEGKMGGSTRHECAKTVRNGAMIALLALCPMRAKNFTALEIGTTFRKIAGAWWITLPGPTTKSRTPYERRVPSLIKPEIDTYIDRFRRVLLRQDLPTNALWVSATSGQQMLPNNVSTLVSRITRQTVGVSVSPHLFRTAAASTAAIYGGDTPYLASAVLDHKDPQVTLEDYTRASSMSAAQAYAGITDTFRAR